MKKEVILFVLIFGIFCLSAEIVSAYTITLEDMDATHALGSITNAVNLYSYGVTYNFTGTITDVSFYNFLSKTLGDTTNGYTTKGNQLMIYESRLDNTQIGINGTGNLFNITHTGTLTLDSTVILDTSGTETDTIVTPDGPVVIVQTVPVSSGGGMTIQHYTLKVVSPGDVTLPEEGIIQVPISMQNPGDVVLQGIHLNASVTFNNFLNREISISLAETDIAQLAPGESKNITVTINANTRKQGIYRVVIYATVDTPKFSDWGEFYIEFKKTNESEADNAVTAVEKIVSDNPECAELREQINQAKTFLDQRDYTKAVAKVQEIKAACEDAIYKKSVYKTITKGIGEGAINYAIIATAAALALGILFYLYKRYKFRSG
jgi:hypothetical protein